MAWNEESVTSVMSRCPLKLNWSIVNWRSSRDFVRHLKDSKSSEALKSPRYETKAGDWLFSLNPITSHCSSCGRIPNASSQRVTLYLRKLNTEGVPHSLLVKGHLKTKATQPSQIDDLNKLWKQQIFFSQVLSDEESITLNLGSTSDIPDSLEISAAFHVFGFSRAIHSKTSTSAADSRCSKCNEQSLLSSDFSALLDDNAFSDVTITVAGQSFIAHKAILAARSPVLGAMLRSDMREKREGAVFIEDTSPAAWSVFQRFLYTESFAVEEDCDLEMFSELIMLSDKYGVPSMVQHLERAIVPRLTRRNALQIYKCVDLFEAASVKEKVVEILLQNWNDLDDETRRGASELVSLSELLFRKLGI